MSQLATTIGWERSRLSHHLQRMAGRGFVERVRSETDGRATDALLTDAGWKVLRSAAPKHVAWVRRLVFSGLSEDAVVALGDILDEVYQNDSARGHPADARLAELGLNFATVDEHLASGHEAARRGGEEHHRGGDLLGPADPAERHVGGQVLEQLLVRHRWAPVR